jgi:hypothetical protein
MDDTQPIPPNPVPPEQAREESTPAEPTPAMPTRSEPARAEPARAEPGPPPPDSTEVARPKNGLGVAALVLGVGSLVAVLSFILFPLALIAGLIGVILGIIALTRAERGQSTNRGQAIAGLTCSGIALIIAIVFAVRVGVWVSDNQAPLRRLESCLTRAGNSQDVGQCFSRFSLEITNR